MIDVCNVKIVVLVHGERDEMPVYFSRETNVMPTGSRTLKSLKPECLRTLKKTLEIIVRETAQK